MEYDCHGKKKSNFVNGKNITNLSKGLSLEKSQDLQNKMAGGRKDDQLEEPRVVLWSRDKIKLGWQNRNIYEGAGMDNLGNTCYMNSSLQVCYLF